MLRLTNFGDLGSLNHFEILGDTLQCTSLFVVLAQIHQSFACDLEFLQETLLLLCASFCHKNGNLAHNHRSLLQMKCKREDITLEQSFLKEFKATCKNSSESELKQRKTIGKAFRLVNMLSALQ